MVRKHKRSRAATDMGEQNLRGAYEKLRPSYTGSPYMEYYAIDAELIEIVIRELKRGKAAGLDTLTAEHLQYCRQLLPTVLAKLFNLMLRYTDRIWSQLYHYKKVIEELANR